MNLKMHRLIADRCRHLDRYGSEPELYCNAGITTALIVGGLAAAGAVGGAAISSHAAGQAADKQIAAADTIRADSFAAADKAKSIVAPAVETANKTLTDAKAEQLAGLKPYLDAGTTSLADLEKIFSPEGELSGAGSKFSFGSGDWENDPGYKYIQSEAMKGVQRTAAAQGTALTGGTEKALARVTSGLASTHLDAAFNRALETYQTNRQNLLTRIQGLQGLTGLGYNALGQQDQDISHTADQVSHNQLFGGTYAADTDLRAAAISAQAKASAANAGGAADIASGNAWANALGQGTNAATSVIAQYKFPQLTMPYSTLTKPGMGLDPRIYGPGGILDTGPVKTGSDLGDNAP